MVTRLRNEFWVFGRSCGALTIELVVAVAILMLAFFPISLSCLQEQKLARALCYRAIAMEIVDGETEVLAAGFWREFNPGVHDYVPRADSVSNLPPGRFELTVDGEYLQLAWLPAKRDVGGPVVRRCKVGP